MAKVKAIRRGYTDRIIEEGEVFDLGDVPFSAAWMERLEPEKKPRRQRTVEDDE